MENITNKRNTTIKNMLLSILFLNWAVAAAKIAYGLLSKCASITADGFHSFSDGTSNIIGLVGIIIASMPKDKDHPYGHKKYETFFSLGIGGLLLIVSFNILKEGIKRIQTPVIPDITVVSFIIMLITLCINIGVMFYEYRRGKELKSDILISDSMHTRADILTSISVIISLIVIKAGYPIIDPVVTILIAFFIIGSAFGIIKRSSTVLCDSAAILDVKKINDIVIRIKGVKTCHKIRTRGRADDIHIDLHVQVNPHMHISEAHKISYNIEDAIKKEIPGVTDVLVHIEPKENKPHYFQQDKNSSS